MRLPAAIAFAVAASVMVVVALAGFARAETPLEAIARIAAETPANTLFPVPGTELEAFINTRRAWKVTPGGEHGVTVGRLANIHADRYVSNPGLSYDPATGHLIMVTMRGGAVTMYAAPLEDILTSPHVADPEVSLPFERVSVEIGHVPPDTLSGTLFGAWHYVEAADAHCGMTRNAPNQPPQLACMRYSAVDGPDDPSAWRTCPCFDADIECRTDGIACRSVGDDAPPPPPGPDFDLKAAIDAAAPGGEVVIPAGTHRQCGTVRTDGLTIRGEPGAALEGVACAGKAALVIEARDVRVADLEISNIQVPSGNGSCIRMDDGVNLTVERLRCHDSEQGIFGGGRVRGGGEGADYSVVVVTGSTFERLGARGQAHHWYMSRAAEVWSIGNTFRAAITGHLIKSGAQKTVVIGGVIDCTGSTDSPSIVDAYNGGELIVSGVDVTYKGCKPKPFQWAAEDRTPWEGSVLVPDVALFRAHGREPRVVLGPN